MKLKKLSFFTRSIFLLRKRWFIFHYAKRYLYPELVAQFFNQLWNTAYAAEKLSVTSKSTAASLPITLVVGALASGKSTLLAASGQILPQSRYLNTDFQPVIGQSLPQYYLTSNQCYIELPEYFLVNDSSHHSHYLEQLLLFWQARRINQQIKKMVLTLRLSQVCAADESTREKQKKFWSGLALLLMHLPGIEIVCVVTEMDRLQGFGEFFSDLSIEERQHLFGFDLSSSADFLTQFKQCAVAMEKRLQRRMWWRCHNQTIFSKRLLAAEFPRQFMVFCHALGSYLAPLRTVLRKHSQGGKVIACCFTSALQQGDGFDLLTQADQILSTQATASQALIVPQNRVYFVRGLFQKFLSKSFSSGHLKNKKSLALPIHYFGKKFLFGLMGIIIAGAFCFVGLIGWNIMHLHQVLQKQPVLAYKIVDSNFTKQNLKAFIAYESWGLPILIQNKLVESPQIMVSVRHAARAYLNQQWKREVYQFYVTHLSGRTPFISQATEESSLKDFNALYAPNGLLIHFKQNYLSSAVMQQLLQDDRAITQLYEYLIRLHAVLYPANQDNAQLSFTLYANQLSSHVRSVRFMFAGKEVMLKNKVLTSMMLNWPNGQMTQNSGYAIQYSHQLPEAQSFNGLWSWIQLFNTLHWQKADAAHTYLVNNAANTFSVKLTASVPLETAPQIIEHLSLPERI